MKDEIEDIKGETELLIGVAFLRGGSGFVQNIDAAKLFLTRASGFENSEAMYQLARVCLADKSVDDAFKWSLSAAKLGHHLAMRLTASLLGAGIGCKVNEQECAEWFVNSGGDGYDGNDHEYKIQN